MDVSYKEAYAMSPEQARMKLVETYLNLREHRRDGAKVAHLSQS